MSQTYNLFENLQGAQEAQDEPADTPPSSPAYEGAFDNTWGPGSPAPLPPPRVDGVIVPWHRVAPELPPLFGSVQEDIGEPCPVREAPVVAPVVDPIVNEVPYADNAYEAPVVALAVPVVALAVAVVAPADAPAAAPVAPADGAMEIDADDQEIVDQATAMAHLGSVFDDGIRRSSRTSRPTDRYVHPDMVELILEGEDVDAVLADFEADSDAEAAMDTESDSDSDYEDY